MVSDIGDIGGERADWGGEIIIERDIILDLILDILGDRLGDIVGDFPQISEFVELKITSLGERKGLAPSSKELATLRKEIIERLRKR